MANKNTKSGKAKKSQVRVRDLKPSKDAKGGGGRPRSNPPKKHNL